MEKPNERTVGSYVAEDYRTASIFQRHGIDFCCRGGQTIDQACDKRDVNKGSLLNELETTMSQGEKEGADFNDWSLDRLADYIEETHHHYVDEQIPVLLQFLNKLCKVHGGRHPELFDISEEFMECAGQLSAHLKKEELILFPFIRKMVESKEENEPFQPPHFGTVENPIEMMKHEHSEEGDRFERIAQLSDNYTPPADGCTTYRVAFQMLRDFDKDLHKHIHLENNILFPKAIELEKALRN